MIKNYIIISFRYLKRNKLYSTLNIIGLSLGLAVSLLIIIFVLHEFSFDKFHEKGDRIYQLTRLEKPGKNSKRHTSLPPALGPALVEDFPGVRAFVRFYTISDVNVMKPTAVDSTFGFVEPVVITDPTIFEVFSFQLIKGDPETALSEPFTVVLTEKVAQKYFGDGNPIGQSLIIDDDKQVTVTGVVEKPPSNSSITFDILLSMSTLPDFFPKGLDLKWNSFLTQTFVLLEPNVDPKIVLDQIPEYVATRSVLAGGDNIVGDSAVPLESRYLFSGVASNFLGPEGNPSVLYIFILVAFLILAIASLNYMNLSTARQFKRAIEVGVRKTVGAMQNQIAIQYLSEAFLLVLVSVFMAFTMVYFAIPVFNNVIQYEMNLQAIDSLLLAAIILGLVILLGMISGSYPAFILSRYNPVKALKGLFNREDQQTGVRFRKGLIVFQFAVSIILVLGTFAIQRQLGFIQSSTFVLEDEKIVVLDLGNIPDKNIVPLKQKLVQRASVKYASVGLGTPYSSSVFGNAADRSSTKYYVDEDFIETYNLKIIKGRDFSDITVESDEGKSVIINETAVRDLDLKNPVGEVIEYRNKPYRIVGVVKDFHYESIHKEIKPLYIFLRYDLPAAMSIRLGVGNIRQTLNEFEKIWYRFTDLPMEYSFIDDKFDSMYKAEDRLASMFNYFTGFAIIVACLGIFGLSSFMAEQRRRELGIRKILGANTYKLMKLLTVDYIILVSIAFAVAVPIFYLTAQAWLSNYAYRIELGVDIFLLTGVLVLVIAIFTVSWQSIRAATANPVESLRSE